MSMNKGIWTQEAVVKAVLYGNQNLEIVLSNYLNAFIMRLDEYDIRLENVGTIETLNKKVLEGIDSLEGIRKEFLSVVEVFATSRYKALEQYLPDFFERLLNHYEERDINLYTGTSADVLRNDHYRFFNQFLMISLTALLIENRCFDALRAILQKKFRVYDKSLRRIRETNFIRFRGYNYTLNEFLNTGSPKRISVTADYILKYAGGTEFPKLIRADILLYYISLWHHMDDVFDRFWYPELSVYNNEVEIMPYLASKAYFEQTKSLFGVRTVQEYKEMLEQTDDSLPRNSLFRVPVVKAGLLYEKVGSLE